MKTHHFTKLSGFMAILFFAASASAQKPNIGGFNVYYGSLHNHSNVSDGLGTPDQAYNYAKNTAHLDFFGLSDHSYLISSSEWSATKSAANIYNEDGVFTTFYGFEWTTLWSYGHVSVFNTEDYYSATTPFTSFNKLLSWVNARDAVAFFNHPGWDEAAYTEFDLFTDTPSDKFVGMELWNDKSETVSISVVQTSLTAISQISGGKDDAEESKKGVVDLASEDIDMVFDTKLTGNQWVGLLFRNLNIPQGAIITKAHIQFTTANATTGSCALTITGQAAANPPDFTSKTRNISSRVKTTSNVLWIPESWNTVGEQTTVQQTPDIKTIVQEIVNRADWSEFSNMVMLISGTGTRTAESYEGNPLLAARIHVEYSLLKSAEIAGHDDLLPVEQDLAGRVSIYPNPVIDNLTILTSEGMKAERVMIYNLTGTLIREITVEELDEKIEVDCSLLKPGLYLLGVQNNRGNHTIKFIKQ